MDTGESILTTLLYDCSNFSQTRNACWKQRIFKNIKDPQSDRGIYITTWVYKQIILLSQHQNMVNVSSNLLRCIDITPLDLIYDNKSIVYTNGIVKVTPNVPFRILIENFDT